MRKGMLQRIKRGVSWLRCVHEAVKIVEPWGILFAASALLLSVVQFWWEFGDRVEERQVRAWQLVTTIAPGNSGKKEALEYLNREDGLFCFESLRVILDWFHDEKDIKCLFSLKSRVPLVGINLSLSANNAVDDSSSNLTGVFLAGVDLREAILMKAKLSGAFLSRADFRGANLFEADLSAANLEDADLGGANLSAANLSFADLSDADLSDADLNDADLNSANLSGANLSGVDLGGVLNLKSSQFDENTCGNSSTKLPNELTIKVCEIDIP